MLGWWKRRSIRRRPELMPGEQDIVVTHNELYELEEDEGDGEPLGERRSASYRP